VRSKTTSLVVLGAAIIAAVVLFVVLRGGSSDTETTAGVTKITVEGGEAVGGVQQITVGKGDRVRLEVNSDTAGEVHVHGYEIEKEIEADEPTSVDFPATLDGGYEIAVHQLVRGEEQGEVEVAELTVNP